MIQCDGVMRTPVYMSCLDETPGTDPLHSAHILIGKRAAWFTMGLSFCAGAPLMIHGGGTRSEAWQTFVLSIPVDSTDFVYSYGSYMSLYIAKLTTCYL